MIIIIVSSLYPKISSFDPNSAYRFGRLDELNNLTESFIEYKKIKEEQRGRLNDLIDLTNKITYTLEGYVRNENSNSIATANLNNDETEAICIDINELAVYLRMYYDIETVKLDPLISSEYPYGNPFSDIVDIMNNGAIIIRFKYVSRNQSTPQEKLVSYHLMEFKDERVLGVHVQGDSKFSMYKQWGQGDERLVPVYPDYNNTIIRWGREELLRCLFNPKPAYEERREFLY